MRILTVLNWLNLGGIELQTLHAIPWLHRQGIEMDFCCTGPPGVLDREFEALGCRIWRIPKTANCFRTARHLHRLLTHASYDVVHSRFGYSSGGYALGAARTGVPVAVSFHNSEAGTLPRWKNRPVLRFVRNQWLRWHRRLMQEHARIFVGHSQANLNAFDPHWRERPDRHRVIMNGIRFPAKRLPREIARRKLRIDDNRVVLLHVGSFTEQKNHTGLLEILRGLVSRLPNAQMILVGDGPVRRDVERLASQMGLGGRVRFEGAQTNVWPYYDAADAFVFPSVFEGFGNVLVESQAAGLPVVASDIEAHHESVAPIQHRFLFQLPRYAAAADMVMEQIESTRSGRNPWVAESQSSVRDRFSTEQYARRLAGLYQELVA